MARSQGMEVNTEETKRPQDVPQHSCSDNTPIYGTSDALNTTPVMVTQDIRKLEGTSTGSP